MSMDVPPDQNTAPVLEFRCLYTADTRRKQKRWQDGRLKFHTFNKRVMVFDEKGNLVGDTHWREKAPLDEGAELELERNGILVAVTEFIERRDQDLTELIDKRVREREERFIARNGDSSPARSAASVIRSQTIAAAHLKPKPLNSILGTPSGHYGKAFIPNTSPFEQRQMLNASHASENDSPRPTKRRKANEPQPSKSGFAQNLMGAALSFTPTLSNTGTIRYESLKLKSIERFKSNDNSEYGDSNEAVPSNRKQSLVVNMDRDIDTSKSRMQARKREKPEKSGYASNLTGASLSLSSLREATSGNMSMNSSVQKNQSTTIDVSVDPSSDGDGHLALVPRPRRAAGKEKKRSVDLSDQISRSSTLPSGITPTSKPAAKESTKLQESQNRASPLNQLPERPHSSLRIRSRPRNKMLMFIDKPSPKSSTFAMENGTNSSVNSDSFILSAKPYSSSKSYLLTTEREAALAAGRASSPLRSSISNDAKNGLVNDYGNNEPHILASRNDLNHSNFEESFSSSADIGVDHQTIDAILSSDRLEAHNSLPNAASSLMDQGHSVYKQRRSSNIGDRSRRPRLDDLSSLIDKIPQRAEDHAQDHGYQLPKHLPKASGTTKKRSGHAVDPNKGAAPDSDPKTNALDTWKESNVRPFLAEGGMTAVSEPTHKPNTRSVTTPNPAEKITPCALQQIPVIPKTTLHPNIADKSKPGNLVPETVMIPKAGFEGEESAVSIMQGVGSDNIESDKLLVGIASNGSTFNATDSFMAKLMPAPNQHRLETACIKTTSSLVFQPLKFPPPAQCSSNNVEIKQSSSSIPDFIPVEQKRSYEAGGFVSANQIIEKEAQSHTHGLSTLRIINPATRGISLQKAAKETLHALVPAVNHIGPLAVISRGVGSGGEAMNNTLGDFESERGGKGPWSRESFDLFGSWRPPVQQS
ncbi:7857a119-93db-43f4-afd1-8f112b2b88f1-CDS [Sclerotinia trifoliorum]|uniref:7857a119-93db-43f4-afd1-8f112b2b88f1-CDS n=1 Tax=Sclerotinia trifoliorum TaxID=28548 RepID=A0A8H2VTG1_9HELO|nr:7857a119-93db-43f4-afd1-8f112b2b88f1-CDS [Sclerotinia trifoliorum]